MTSESRMNRRLHAADYSVRKSLFFVISEIFKKRNQGREYILDSFPVPVCDNIRISRARIFKGEEYRGYMASKKRYFYGLRVHMIVTAQKEPAEFLPAPGAPVYEQPPESVCYGDKAYNDWQHEDMLKELPNIVFRPIRKKNSLRAVEPVEVRRAEQYTRRHIKTGFSMINNFFPKKIHAVTQKGFALKPVSFILVFAIQFL